MLEEVKYDGRLVWYCGIEKYTGRSGEEVRYNGEVWYGGKSLLW